MIYLYAIIIPLLSFFLQSYPRLFNKYFGVDVWTRLLEIEHVRSAGHKIPGKISKGFIINGYFDYPIVFPWLFSFFSQKTLLRLQGFVSPFFDVLQNIILFFITYTLTHNLTIAFVAQTIYSLTPMIPIENSYMTPRSLGYLVFTLAFYPILLFHINGDTRYLLLGLLFTTLLFLVHRFALQAFLFLSLFFTIIDHSFWYLEVFINAFLLATVLTKGYYLRVAKGHLANIYFWVLNSKYRFAHQVFGNQKAKKQDWVGKAYRLLSTFSPIFLFSISIWTFFAILYVFLYLTHSVFIERNLVLYKMSLWVSFFYVFSSLVLKVKHFIPIGEGQRYLEMATVPTSILSAVIFFEFYKRFGISVVIIFMLLLLYNFGLILFVQIKGIIADKNRSLTSELLDMYRYINSLKGTPRMICIPHQITTMTVYHTKADILVNADNVQLMTMFDFYPVLKKPLAEIAKKYKIDYLLLRETYTKTSDLKIKSPRIIYRSGDVVLIKL